MGKWGVCYFVHREFKLAWGQWLSNYRVYQNHLKGFLKDRLLNPTPVVVGNFPPEIFMGCINCISSKCPGDADAAGLGTTCAEPLLWYWVHLQKRLAQVKRMSRELNERNSITGAGLFFVSYCGSTPLELRSQCISLCLNEEQQFLSADPTFYYVTKTPVKVSTLNGIAIPVHKELT